jgi:hypothetical protein
MATVAVLNFVLVAVRASNASEDLAMFLLLSCMLGIVVTLIAC